MIILGRMQHLGVGRGKRRSQGERKDGRVNHNTALSSTKGINRFKGRQVRLAYWA